MIKRILVIGGLIALVILFFVLFFYIEWEEILESWVIYLFSTLLFITGLFFLIIGRTQTVVKEAPASTTTGKSTAPTTQEQKGSGRSWIGVIIIVILCGLFYYLYDQEKIKTIQETDPTFSPISLSFNKWTPDDLAWQKIKTPDELIGEPFHLYAKGIHYMPYEENGLTKHLKVDPSRGAYPWVNYPVEALLPIKDKTNLCKLIIKTEHGIQLAGKKSDPIIKTVKGFVWVSLNYIQNNPTAWETAYGQIDLRFVPLGS